MAFNQSGYPTTPRSRRILAALTSVGLLAGALIGAAPLAQAAATGEKESNDTYTAATSAQNFLELGQDYTGVTWKSGATSDHDYWRFELKRNGKLNITLSSPWEDGIENGSSDYNKPFYQVGLYNASGGLVYGDPWEVVTRNNNGERPWADKGIYLAAGVYF
ncbi:MAG: hypothetical protein LBQ92_03400, partial [Propionibacteriaceae bacterium]|nr:hypothetical protein [Propionibacteriaceae bacterium]